MENSKQELLKEYCKRFKTSHFYNARIAGYDRFSVNNHGIEVKSLFSVLYAASFAILSTLCNIFMIYKIYIEHDIIFMNEVILFVQFTIFHLGFMINIMKNRFLAPEIIYNSVDIDVYLGVIDTKPLRDIQFTVFRFFHTIVSLVGLGILFQLCFIAHDFMTLDLFFFAFIYFYTVYQIYYDLVFFLTLYLNITLRVRYLNTALMRIVQVKSEYLPDILGQKMFWKKKYNDYFDASNNVDPEKIIPTFKSIFSQIRLIESVYRFTILQFMSSIPLGTFLVVYSFTIYNQTQNLPISRLILVLLWGLSSWAFILFMSVNVDLLTRHIQQTNLICTFTQLKPSSTDEAFKLTKLIIRTLSVRDPRMSIYDLYYFDVGLVFRTAASIFVYITAQIQLSFLPTEDLINLNTTINSTSFIKTLE